MVSMSLRTQLLVAALALLVIVGGFFGLRYLNLQKTSSSSARIVTASTTLMRYEIADTQAKQELGLGTRSSIPDNYGMLFVFPGAERYGFWMKDMLVPIDIIWLSDNGEILLIDHEVEPKTYPHVFYPPTPVKYVLETRSGWARESGWDVGTRINLPAPYGPGDK